MSHLISSAGVPVIAGAALLALGAAADASPVNPTGVQAPGTKASLVPGAPSVLIAPVRGYEPQGVLVNTGILSSGAVAAGYVNVDAPTTFNCANGGTGSCLYELEAHVQIHNSATDNPIAICFLIDGLLVNGGCYYSDTGNTGTYYQQISAGISKYPVTRGQHTVQTQVYTLSGLDDIYFYNLEYSNYSRP